MATPVVQAQNWWAQVLRGAVAIIFGLAVLSWPSFALVSLRVLVLLFGVYALVDGTLAIISTVRSIQEGTPWWSHLVEGIVGIVVGLLVLFWPGLTSLVLLYLIAAWAIIVGIFKIVSAIPGVDWLLMASGGVSIVLGLLLVAARSGGALAFVQIIGIFALIFGFLMLVNGFEMRTQPHRPRI